MIFKKKKQIQEKDDPKTKSYCAEFFTLLARSIRNAEKKLIPGKDNKEKE